MNASFNLMRRLPPKAVPKNLGAIISLIDDEDLKFDVQQKTDQPIEIGDDTVEGKPFLKCEYNMFGDSFRSPWSNTYFPEPEDAEEQVIYPSEDLLRMEQAANVVFQRYAQLYYDKDYLTSVYFFDTNDSGFGSCWLVNKNQEFPGSEEASIWDSTHVVKTTLEQGNKARYKVTSTVFLTL
jgi:capping protein beta